MNYENERNYQNDIESIPAQYRPLSPWAYFGYNVLFAIPIIGLIVLIVLAFNKDNIHRRNYARSYFCAMLISVVLMIPLAFIVFQGSTETISQAGFASFVMDISEMRNMISVESANMRGNYAANGEMRTTAQIYYEIATGKAAQLDEKIPDGEKFGFDFLDDDEVCYRIVDFSKIEGYEDAETLDINGDRKNNDKYYITSKGNVFTLPGYEREEDGKTYYYLNGSARIAEDDMSL
ncbi:MAG: hypothetical protein IJX99_02945 [Clostridia bacterium]|nr:hypothetical protein [Clostridia bacterium]